MKDPWDLCSRNPHSGLVCLNLGLSLAVKTTNQKLTKKKIPEFNARQLWRH